MNNNFNLKSFLAEGTLLKENEGELTPLQQYVFDYEAEISGEEGANNELNNIKKLNSIDDVDQYYGEYRGWRQDRDLQYDLENLINDLEDKF